LTWKINRVLDTPKDYVCTKFGQNPLKDFDPSVHKDVTEGRMDGRKEGRTDGRTDGIVTISQLRWRGDNQVSGGGNLMPL
jgi:hypothetical protein